MSKQGIPVGRFGCPQLARKDCNKHAWNPLKLLSECNNPPINISAEKIAIMLKKRQMRVFRFTVLGWGTLSRLAIGYRFFFFSFSPPGRLSLVPRGGAGIETIFGNVMGIGHGKKNGFVGNGGAQLVFGFRSCADFACEGFKAPRRRMAFDPWDCAFGSAIMND